MGFILWFFSLAETPRMLRELTPLILVFVVFMPIGLGSIYFNAYVRPGWLRKRLRTSLAEADLQEEVSEAFTGFKGMHRGYFIKVHTQGTYSFKVVLHYMPVANSRGNINYKAMQRIADNYSVSYLFGVAYLDVEPAYLCATVRVNLLTCVFVAKRLLKQLVKIAEQEKLQPLTEAEWERLVGLGREEFHEPENV